MSKKSNQVEETAQQRALAEYAQKQWTDYKTRWLPVQKNLAAQIQEMGEDGSRARVRAEGRASNDTTAKFGAAEQALETALANKVNLGSSRAKLGITGMTDDKAKATGLGVTLADQQIDDAYTEGLGALTAIGRGERQSVGNAMGRQAETSARQAEMDAEAALNARMGNAGVVGQAVGLGIQQFGKPSGGSGPVNGYLTSSNPNGFAGSGMSGGYVTPTYRGP